MKFIEKCERIKFECLVKGNWDVFFCWQLFDQFFKKVNKFIFS